MKTRIDQADKAVNWSAIAGQSAQGSVVNLAVRRKQRLWMMAFNGSVRARRPV
jgi:hypothetical protein